MTQAERGLLVHRLRDLAYEHERCQQEDGAADTADTLVLSATRSSVLDADLLREAATALSIRPDPAQPQPDYQQRVDAWIQHCFGPVIGADRTERNHRFLEEALELVQSGGCTISEAHQLVDYVFGRPTGDLPQEVGGVMNTLAALCTACGVDMQAEAERELVRVWGASDKIRAKQAAKPKHSPLPGGAQPQPGAEDAALVEVVARAIMDQRLWTGAYDNGMHYGNADAERDAWRATARAATAAVREREGWQSAKTPPESGRLVLVKGGVAYWQQEDRSWWTLTGEDYPGRRIEWTVTHWMPLPTPPAGDAP